VVDISRCGDDNMTTRKLNKKWDSLLTPNQRELLTKPGFGIVKDLPYLGEEEVRKIMIISEEYLKHIDLIINKD
jgi:hypothetical protein